MRTFRRASSRPHPFARNILGIIAATAKLAYLLVSATTKGLPTLDRIGSTDRAVRLVHGEGDWRFTMTKKEMAQTIAEAMGVPQTQVKEVIQRVFDGIIDTLEKEGRIELRRFGVFEVKHRRARVARNPRTGETVMVPAKNVVTFKQGREMEERVGQLTKVTA
jgi:integration host factor subunit beta